MKFFPVQWWFGIAAAGTDASGQGALHDQAGHAVALEKAIFSQWFCDLNFVTFFMNAKNFHQAFW